MAAEKAINPSELASQLASPDVAVRRHASYELSKLGGAAKAALPALIEALEDPDKQVWSNAITAVSAIGPDATSAIAPLIADFDSKSAGRQRSYYRDQVLIRNAYALARIGTAAIPALIEGLDAADTMMQSGAARALGGMGASAKEAVPALMRKIGHPDESVQRDVIDALSQIGKAAMPVLIEALSWKDARQRSGAAQALGAMGRAARDAAAPMVARLSVEADPAARASLLTVLPKLGTDVSGALIEGLKDDRELIQRAAVNGLLTAQTGKAAIVKALTALLNEPAFSERAAYVLGRLGESAAPAVPSLLLAMANSQPPPPAFLDALVQIGEPAVTPILVSFEKADPASLTSQHWAVRCLQQMGGLGVAPIMRNLQHPSPSVRVLAARTLAELGPDAESATPALLKATEDENLNVRAVALIALAGVRAPVEQIEPYIENGFKHPAPIVRSAAVEAAARLGPESGRTFHERVIAALKDQDESVRNTAISQLGPAFADAVPLLIPLLDDPVRRQSASEALGRIGAGASGAVPKLSALVSNGTKADRIHALQALGQIGPAANAAMPEIEGALKDAELSIRIAAYQAGAQIEWKKDKRVALLTSGLDDENIAVRKAVAETIGRLGDQASDAFVKLATMIDRDSDREFALTALGQLRIRDVSKLASLLDHPQTSVQIFACYQLVNAGRRARQAVPALEKHAQSSNEDLARAARRAIRSITQ